jgi:hypothetical protein
MDFGKEIESYYGPHIEQANGMSIDALMAAATSWAVIEAEKGHEKNLEAIKSASGLSFSNSYVKAECSACLSKVTKELRELNSKYTEISKRPLPVRATGDRELTAA